MLCFDSATAGSSAAACCAVPTSAQPEASVTSRVPDFVTGEALHTKKYLSPLTKLRTGEGSSSRNESISQEVIE